MNPGSPKPHIFFYLFMTCASAAGKNSSIPYLDEDGDLPHPEHDELVCAVEPGAARAREGDVGVAESAQHAERRDVVVLRLRLLLPDEAVHDDLELPLAHFDAPRGRLDSEF